ncbi:MAG: sigma-70 family RNA polymerase sigma factor [Labilithrix sp.]|nr:sigma-70 family RNA polymerase sigma factor [Labilithrix sp.]MBX3220323.1 sigma-70 family RNA polymerase sigma factor [Labilithrix sp.]
MASSSAAIVDERARALARTGDAADARDLEQRKVALIRAHLTSVWGFLRRLGLSPADAEDAGQEVFLTAVGKMDAIYEGQEKRFLFGIAVRVASRRRRSTKSFTSRAVDLDVDTCEGADPSSEEILERREALELLDRALATLNDEMRTVFILYELEEMTMPEIAAVLDAPIGTVASRLRRAREQFQKATRRMQKGQP